MSEPANTPETYLKVLPLNDPRAFESAPAGKTIP